MSSDPTLVQSAVESQGADALYAQGMAHYRRREWPEARECFIRLRALAPDRRGVDALLKEVDLFIQLEAMQPEQRQAALEPVDEQAQETTLPATGKVPATRSSRRSPWTIVILSLAVIMAAALALYSSGMLDQFIGSRRLARVQALVNQGRAAMNVGEYDRAVRTFGEALALAPGDEEIKTWYAKAQRFQQLAALYAQAESDIAEEEWDRALERLEKIASIDPTYAEVGAKISMVKGQQALQAEFALAQQAFDSGHYDEAIRTLEQLREQNPSFRTTEVVQVLFDSYYRQGAVWMSDAGESLDLVAQAIQSFDRALALRPDDEGAEEDRRLADLYRQGYLFYNQNNWPQAALVLQQIHSVRPAYAEGRVASMLCSSYLQLGDAYYGAGDLLQALQQYKNVLAMDSCDHVEAAIREREINAILYPPTATPTPTATRTLTPTLVPTPTVTVYVPPTSQPPKPTSRPATPAPPTPKPR